MAPRLYVEIASIGNVNLYQVSVDPNGVVVAPRGSLAFRSDAGNAATYQNTDGATAWTVIDGSVSNTFSDGSTFASLAPGSNGSIVIANNGYGYAGPVPYGTIETTASTGGYGLLAGASVVSSSGSSTVAGVGAGVILGSSYSYGSGYSVFRSTYAGGLALGRAVGADYYASITTYSGVVGGYAGAQGANAGLFAGYRSFSWGNAYGKTQVSYFGSVGYGSFCSGYIYNGGRVQSSADGSRASGSVSGGGPITLLVSLGRGSRVWGAPDLDSGHRKRQLRSLDRWWERLRSKRRRHPQPLQHPMIS